MLIDPVGLTPLGQKGFSVYGLFEEGAKEPYYVGITNNTDSRELQHGNIGRLKGNDTMRILDPNTDMTYAEARGKEQFFIDKHKTKTGQRGQELNMVVMKQLQKRIKGIRRKLNKVVKHE